MAKEPFELGTVPLGVATIQISRLYPLINLYKRCNPMGKAFFRSQGQFEPTLYYRIFGPL